MSSRGVLLRSVVWFGVALSISVPATGADGDLDTTFGVLGTGIVTVAFDAGGTKADVGHAVMVARSGALFAAGFATTSSDADSAVAKLYPDGEINTFFAINGRLVFDANFKEQVDDLNAIGELSTGELVVAGVTGDNGATIAKISSSGSLLDQRVFGFPGQAGFRSLAVQPDDKIVLAGWVNRNSNYAMLVMRLKPDLSRDSGFGINGEAYIDFDIGSSPYDDDIAYAVALDSHGRIVVAGYAVYANQDWDFAVARLLPGGGPDPGFSGDGRATSAFDFGPNHKEDVAYSVAIGDGDTVFVGGGSGMDGYPLQRATLLHLLADGSPDGNFGNTLGAGRQVLLGIDIDLRTATGLAIAGNGQIYICGSEAYTGLLALARLSSAGILDSSFGGGDGVVSHNIFFSNANDGAWGMTLQGGKPLVVGWGDYSLLDDDSDFALVRFEAALIFADSFESGSSWRWSDGAL